MGRGVGVTVAVGVGMGVWSAVGELDGVGVKVTAAGPAGVRGSSATTVSSGVKEANGAGVGSSVPAQPISAADAAQNTTNQMNRGNTRRIRMQPFCPQRDRLSTGPASGDSATPWS